MTDPSGSIHLRNSSAEQLQPLPELGNNDDAGTVNDLRFGASETSAPPKRLKNPFDGAMGKISKKFGEMKFHYFERPSLRKGAVDKLMELNPGLPKKGAEGTVKSWTQDRIADGMTPRQAFQDVNAKLEGLLTTQHNVARVEEKFPGVPKFDSIVNLLMAQDSSLTQDRAVHFAATTVVEQFEATGGHADIDAVLDLAYFDAETGNGNAPEWMVYGRPRPDVPQPQQNRTDNAPSVSVPQNAEPPADLFFTPTRNELDSRPPSPPSGFDIGRSRLDTVVSETEGDPFPTPENRDLWADPFPDVGAPDAMRNAAAIPDDDPMKTKSFDLMMARLEGADDGPNPSEG